MNNYVVKICGKHYRRPCITSGLALASLTWNYDVNDANAVNAECDRFTDDKYKVEIHA